MLGIRSGTKGLRSRYFDIKLDNGADFSNRSSLVLYSATYIYDDVFVRMAMKNFSFAVLCYIIYYKHPPSQQSIDVTNPCSHPSGSVHQYNGPQDAKQAENNAEKKER